MKTLSFALLLVVGVIAAPSPAHIEIDIDTDAGTTPVSTQKHPFQQSDGFCIPFYGQQCGPDSGEEGPAYDCCPPFKCINPGGNVWEVKRCLIEEEPDHTEYHHKTLFKADDGDEFCIPPFKQTKLFCNIGGPNYKCCDSDQFECKEFGRSGMYGCQAKPRPDMEKAAAKYDNGIQEASFHTNGDGSCLPPWQIAHMFCGIGAPKYNCCDDENFACKKLDGPQGTHYGCLPKGDDQGLKLSKIKRPFNELF